ncbi:AAEL017091-PA [Aedes aegypti]|uniref:AAEL017091-PA n=1 Tax=Aedes aegypti TaxID=7159 RepID=J9HJK2_AEDAE|nr:AAEL017091-PA [Aedes aegypti]
MQNCIYNFMTQSTFQHFITPYKLYDTFIIKYVSA